MKFNEVIKDKHLYGNIPAGLLFLDLETTGLIAARSHITVIGAAYVKDGCLHTEQFFADRPSSEKEAILGFLELTGKDIPLAHYNGRTFDIPYLIARIRANNIGAEFSFSYDTDIYKIVQRNKNLISVNDLRQKSIEGYLNISRKDSLSGRECIKCYYDYLETGDCDKRNALLLHNREDLLGMCGIYSSFGAFDVIDGDFELTGCILNKDTIVISAEPGKNIIRPVSMEGRNIRVDITHEFCRTEIKGEHTTKKFYFGDPENYFYLPEEDTAIHKSVAKYVDRSRRVRANTSNCYEKHEGLFFPQPRDIIIPSFRNEHNSKESFFRADDLISAGKLTQKKLMESWMKKLRHDQQTKP